MTLQEQMADAFAKWADSRGILARVTREQAADLALAFGAGAVYGMTAGPEQQRCMMCGATDHNGELHRDPMTGLIGGGLAPEPEPATGWDIGAHVRHMVATYPCAAAALAEIAAIQGGDKP